MLFQPFPGLMDVGRGQTMISNDREANGYFEASLLVAALAGLGVMTHWGWW